MHKSLLDVVANAELLDELTVLIDVVLLDVGEETTTLTDEHEQTTAGVEVLLVGLHVLGQLLDALGQDGDLNLGVAGVLGVLAELGGARSARPWPPSCRSRRASQPLPKWFSWCCVVYLVNVSTGGSQCGLKRPHPTSACLSGGKVSVNN